MKMEISLNFLMRKENNSIIKLDDEEVYNMTTIRSETLPNITNKQNDEIVTNHNLEFDIYLGLLIIFILVTIPPSFTVIIHILM
jgi:hypothetical protein